MMPRRDSATGHAAPVVLDFAGAAGLDDAGAAVVCHGIVAQGAAADLRLGGSALTGAAADAIAAAAPHIRRLALDGVRLAGCCAALFAALARAPQLQTLSLVGCGLADADALELATALSSRPASMPRIALVSLADNPAISPTAAAAVAAACAATARVLALPQAPGAPAVASNPLGDCVVLNQPCARALEGNDTVAPAIAHLREASPARLASTMPKPAAAEAPASVSCGEAEHVEQQVATPRRARKGSAVCGPRGAMKKRKCLAASTVAAAAAAADPVVVKRSPRSEDCGLPRTATTSARVLRWVIDPTSPSRSAQRAPIPGVALVVLQKLALARSHQGRYAHTAHEIAAMLREQFHRLPRLPPASQLVNKVSATRRAARG